MNHLTTSTGATTTGTTTTGETAKTATGHPATTTDQLRANAEQSRVWNGATGRDWAHRQLALDASMAAHHRRLLEAAAIRESDCVLDVGCGTGRLARDAARRAPNGWVLGVDLSQPMIDVAGQWLRGFGMPGNLTFAQGDAQERHFRRGAFDVVLSRFGTMFFDEPIRAFANLHQAIAPGGRLVMLVWRSACHNPWLHRVQAALGAHDPSLGGPAQHPAPGPFSLADSVVLRGTLERAGFGGIHLERCDEQLWLGATLERAEEFALGYAGWLLDRSSAHERAVALERLRAELAAHRSALGISYDSSAWLVSATHAVT